MCVCLRCVGCVGLFVIVGLMCGCRLMVVLRLVLCLLICI